MKSAFAGAGWYSPSLRVRLLLAGLRYWPALLATIVAADAVVRGAPGGYFITLFTSVTLAGGYAAMAWMLRVLLADLGLRSSRHLTLFVAVALGGTAIVGAAFVGVLRGAELLGATPLPNAWLRFWIGDDFDEQVLASLSATDTAEAQAAAVQAAKIWIDDFTGVAPIAYLPYLYGASNKVQGLTPHPAALNQDWSSLSIAP